MDRSTALATASATLNLILRTEAEDGDRVMIAQPGKDQVEFARARETASHVVEAMRAGAAPHESHALSMDDLDTEAEAYPREQAAPQAGA